jgi:hypothetical protein
MRILGPIALMFLVVSSAAAQIPGQKNSLKGITDVTVEVVPVEKTFETNGLTTEKLRTDTELRLRQSGIKVKEYDPKTFQLPHLEVGIGLLKSSDGLCTYVVSASLINLVNTDIQTEGKPTIETMRMAILWQTVSFGRIGCTKVGELRPVLIDGVDEFINDYLAVNPKK